jgi:hypothetical protein
VAAADVGVAEQQLAGGVETEVDREDHAARHLRQPGGGGPRTVEQLAPLGALRRWVVAGGRVSSKIERNRAFG